MLFIDVWKYIFKHKEKNMKKEFISVKKLNEETISFIKKRTSGEIFNTGIKTGFTKLDSLLLLQKGTLNILAGSLPDDAEALAINIALNIVKQQSGVAYFLMNKSITDFGVKMSSVLSKTPVSKINQGNIRIKDFLTIEHQLKKIGESSLSLYNNSFIFLNDFKSKCRDLKKKGKLDIIIIDNLYVLKIKEYTSEDDRVEKICFELQALAKELEVPILALCNFSASQQWRENPYPFCSDIRVINSILPFADSIMILYREEAHLQCQEPYIKDSDFENRKKEWLEKMDKVRNKAEIMIAKNNNGPSGFLVKLSYDSKICKFGDAKDFV